MGGNHKDPRSGLREEGCGINLKGTKAIALKGQGLAKGSKVRTSVRG